MTADPRAALSGLIAALETHLETAAVSRGEDDSAVLTAYDRLAEAFLAYDKALLEAYGEVTPLEVYDDEDEDDEDGDDEDQDGDDEDQDDEDGDDDSDDDADGNDEDDDFDDDDGPYLGLDDEDYDVDERERD